MPASLRKEQVAKLLYALKAWKVLSENDQIAQSDLTYEVFFHSKIEIKKLLDIFNTLAKSHKVFELFLQQSTILSKIKDQDLILLFGQVEIHAEFIRVTDMFYSLLEGLNDYSVSNQIAELGVKLLGKICDEVYTPFSNSLNICYFTNKTIYAESMADEFIVELMKIVDGIDVTFHHTDVLDHPSYINQDAPHLLKQFECSLSFPPMGLSLGNALRNEDTFNRFKIHKGKGNRDVVHIEHILAQTQSKAVVLLPVGMTYRSGTELELRKYLIDNNLLEAIIQLPANLHNETSIETTFFIINKDKQDDKVYFINLKDDQFLKKDGRKTILNDLEKILGLYEKREEVENISKLISNETIIQNSYAFAIDRYVVSKEAAAIQEKLSKYKLIELQEIADVRRSQLFQDEGEGTEIYEVSPSDLARTGFTSSGGKLKHIDKQLNKLTTYELKTFDVLLSTKGTIGKVGIISTENDHLIASQAMQVIRLKSGRAEDAYMLYMYLKSDIGQSLLKQLVAGVAMPQIATAEIKKFKIPIMTEEDKDRVLANYLKERDLYQKMEKIEQEIKDINNNYFGDK